MRGPATRLLLALAWVAALSVGALPASAQPSPSAAPCAAPIDARQAEQDRVGIAAAAESGLTLEVARQCAGFSVLYEATFDQELLADYVQGAEYAYTQLARETSLVLSPRGVVLLFADEESTREGIRALGGRILPAREHPGIFAWVNSIWIDDALVTDEADRLGSLAHELTHLFVSEASGGSVLQVPLWLNEGLATYQEIYLGAERFPGPSAQRAADYREAVLRAASGDGSLPLFSLRQISSPFDWNRNYANSEARRLQYGQAYMAVRWLVERTGSTDAVWTLLKRMGSGERMPGAFEEVFGLSVAEAEEGVRAALAAELERPPDVLRLEFHIAPEGLGTETALALAITTGNGVSVVRAPVSQPGVYTFEVANHGLIGFPHELELLEGSRPLPRPRQEDDPTVRVVQAGITGAAAGTETTSYRLSYGRWAPGFPATRLLFSDEETVELLAGPLSAPFPDGNAIVARADE